MIMRAEDSVLVVVDMQPSFLRPIHGADQVLERCQFLVKVAKRLGVPIIATAQYPDRMGGLCPELSTLLPGSPIGKLCFSCAGEPKFNQELERTKRTHAILCGIETHICVTQTALDLIEGDYDVAVVGDAVSARSGDMHSIGLARMRDVGVEVVHSESAAYEWLGTAENEAFRDVLAMVKGQ